MSADAAIWRRKWRQASVPENKNYGFHPLKKKKKKKKKAKTPTSITGYMIAKHSQWLKGIWITSQNGCMMSRLLTRSGTMRRFWRYPDSIELLTIGSICPHQTSHHQRQGVRTGQYTTALTRYFSLEQHKQTGGFFLNTVNMFAKEELVLDVFV